MPASTVSTLRATPRRGGLVTRRASLVQLGSGMANAALLALAISRVPGVAAQQEPEPPPQQFPSGPPPCLMPFEATVRQGPRAGLALHGLLTFTVDPSGAINDGVFALDNGSQLAVVGQTTGRAISLLFDQGDGTFLFGTGVGQVDVRLCGGTLGGPFVGSLPGEAGDWIGTVSDTEQDATGVLYFVVPSDHAIYSKTNLLSGATLFAGVVGSPGLVDGARLAARFSGPTGIGVNLTGGALLIADHGNQVIRRLNLSTGQVTTRVTRSQALAAGVSQFGAWDVAVDSLGNLFITDNVNHVIWYYTTSSASLRILAGSPGQPGKVDGTGSAARFNNPQQAEISPDGRILNVLDVGNNLVRLVTQTGQVASIGSSATP